MSGNINVAFNGTATSPTYWVRLNTVQENDQTAGYGHGSIENWVAPALPLVSGYFLHCTAMAGENFNGYFADDYGSLQAQMVHSEFWSGALMPYGDNMAYTNCLFWRPAQLGVNNGSTSSSLVLRNCTMIGGTLSINRNAAEPVSIRDSAFDGTTIATGDTYGSNATYTDYDYNAYTNTTDPFSLGGAHDVIVTNFNWQPSWFGNYYQATSLLTDEGDVTASQVGLYHFTTQTNQIPESNSIVDIGYHYVATDNNGNPISTYTNGVPDYIADSDGNGLPDWWEIQYFGHTGIDPNGDPDGDYLNNLQEYQYGTNPTNADTDGDGRTDWQEIMDNTDPLNPNSYAKTIYKANVPNTTHPQASANPVLAIWVSNNIAYVALTNGMPNTFYDLFGKTNLLSSWIYLGKLNLAAQYTNSVSANQQYYFEIGSTLDSDGDGLSDMYENLVSHTNPNNVDTDGDGISDSDEILFGTNPLVPDFTWKEDSDNDGLPDKYESSIGLNPNSAESAPVLPVISVVPVP